MTFPWRPRPFVVPGTADHRLIRGVLRMDIAPPHTERVELIRTQGWMLSVVDTGPGDSTGWTPRGDLTIHVLWQQDEENAAVETAGGRLPIAPGDTMSVPGGNSLRRSPGMLLAQVEASSRSLAAILPPDHGRESFEGYNRRTDYGTPQAFSLARWKITQPLTLPVAGTPYAVVAIAAPLALAWPAGTDLIRRGECRVIPPATGPVTLLPGGLGYALIVR